ncbi:MAG: hypothetical protein IPM43_10255 [Actinomycetota bacterium]|nr:MAG: hypothetical protein IPM43_10255 [Actinomycetota bacterium]
MESTDATDATGASIPAEIVRRRSDIGGAVAAVERALEAAAGTQEWQTHVSETIAKLRQLVAEQVVAYEAEGGVFDDIVLRAPRLASHVKRVRATIEPLASRLDVLSSQVSTDEPDVVRDGALVIITDIVRARQKIADLVWDACSVDLGGSSS